MPGLRRQARAAPVVAAMSYLEVAMFVVVCNRCGVEYDGEYAGWASKATADEVAKDGGWTATRGRHLCTSCVAVAVEDPAAFRIESMHGEVGPADQPLPIGRQDGPREAA